MRQSLNSFVRSLLSLVLGLRRLDMAGSLCRLPITLATLLYLNTHGIICVRVCVCVCVCVVHAYMCVVVHAYMCVCECLSAISYCVG